MAPAFPRQGRQRREGTTISSPSDPPSPRSGSSRGGRRARSLSGEELARERALARASAWEQPGDDLEDWTQDTEPAPPARPRLAAWTAGALPSTASSLDDWLQGPREARAEREAEDAWSTAGSVSAGAAPAGTGGARVTEEGAPPRVGPAFRHELHGLRAVALGLVAIYHIWFGRVSGGVDVFLFLSAFFLTGTFVRRLESGRPLGVPRYWLHTFKRLMPPAAVTILLTLAGTAAFLPSSLWPAVMQEAVASAAYLQNALLVFLQVDYHARDAGGASPLQHFWSLSVQGQAFVVWPLLFLLMVRRARAGRNVRRPLSVLLLVLGAASLTWSIISTGTQQQVAYFDTAARLWEFAAGSLLALALPAIDRLTGARRPEEGQVPQLRTGRALIGWAGIGALLACGIVLDVSTMFPGWIASVPLAAAGAVVIAGHSGRRWGVDALLSTRPAAFVGDISYALYLVHWPVLVMWLHHSGRQRAGLLDGLVILVGSVLLAWLITRAVDAPVRRSVWLEARPRRALTAVAASFALVAAAAGGWWIGLTRAEPPTPVAAAQEPATQEAATEVATEAPREILPHGWQLGSQWPDLPERCGGPWAPAEDFHHVNCQQLLPADATAKGTIVVVGSSHARQFIPALIPYASAHDLQIVNLSMDACGFTTEVEASPYCRGYDQYVLDYVEAHSPELVLTTVTLTGLGADETVPAGTEAAVRALLERDAHVIGVRDTPRWEQDQFACAEAVIEGGGAPSDADAACGADAEKKLAPENPAAGLAELPGAEDALALIDLSGTICPHGRCSPILGETSVYMDDNHLTRTFVETVLVGPMTEELDERFPAPTA
ncbi:acyltransferase family protein [Brachybacterium sacelli]|uniref:Peptidoglycan/LPS O-acetylase OafA/YrhL n=1 Tax=Brachybacterium sacelli TaxID=173364 RepID=A0ABS4X3A4_9MICO|nr:acyltransferase family protein [Brachybacterium sacelli]MBP2382907.1 peptidoglycan/LPS O-acetylase OafA/YrhL [Brachybacterium sacelli]